MKRERERGPRHRRKVGFSFGSSRTLVRAQGLGSVTVDGPIKRFVGCHKTVPCIVVRLDGQNWTVTALKMLNLRKK